MTDSLLAVSIGPMQEFISAARRTRDLWFGSFLLSEISKAVAARLLELKADLIFPTPAGPADLTPGSNFIVSNVLLARLPRVAGNPADLWPKLKQAAHDRWEQLATEATQGLAAGWIVRPRWERQLLEGVVEFYAAWQPIGSEGQYPRVRARVMRLLAGRKACRDFAPWSGSFGVPKSSLDGARETVLAELDMEESDRRAAFLKLAEAEQLDAIGLTKRRGGMALRQYPSVSRVAADPWLRGLLPADLTRLTRDAEQLVEHGLVRVTERTFPQYQSFPYEAAAVYTQRSSEAVEDAPEARRQALLRDLRSTHRVLYRKYGEPGPYLAILVADGDRMGSAISSMETSQRHQLFSSRLSEFACQAASLVADHRGLSFTLAATMF